MTTPEEQIPLLCKRCGAPAESRADLTLRCAYCGLEDRLPDDELGRALDLKARVAAAARSVAQLRGAESTLSHIFESRGALLRVAGPMPVFAALILVYVLVGMWPSVNAAPANLQASLIINSLLGPFFIIGITIAFPLSLLVGRAKYRRKIRPLLLARPPKATGMPARCRGCGAGLPDSREPFVRCKFCMTENLVSIASQQDSARLLSEEHAQYQRRASGISQETTQIASNMTRTLIVIIVLVYAGLIGAMYAANLLLSA